MKLLVATNNAGKLREISQILRPSGIEVVSLEQAGVRGDPVEDGATFEKNALIKAHFFAEKSDLPTVADDSGLCVNALGGAPGIFSARYSGPDATDASNNALLLEKMHDIPDQDRTAHFFCAMVCVRPDGKSLLATGKSEGLLLREPRGNNGFGYDPLFFVPEYDQTFAQLPPEKKHAISHRGRALANLVRALPGFLEQ